MARKNGSSDALGGIVIVVGIIGVAALFLFLILATTAFYLTPVAMLAAYLWVQDASASPPALADAAQFDPEPETAAVANALAARRLLAEQHQLLHETGMEAGISLTKASNETRFDTRPRLGRDLNRQLDQTEADFRALSDQIEAVRRQVFASLPEWRAPFDQWARKRAAFIALVAAGVVMVLTVLSLYALPILSKGTMDGIQQLLLWNPWNAVPLGGLVVASLVGYATFGVVFLYQRRALPALLEGPEAEAWFRLLDKWSPLTDGDDHFPDVLLSSEPAQASGAGETWHEVLGVPADAPQERIKSAYREAMKGYHPDRVVGLGEKLKAVAEAEAKRINAAYEEACAERGFR